MSWLQSLSAIQIEVVYIFTPFIRGLSKSVVNKTLISYLLNSEF